MPNAIEPTMLSIAMAQPRSRGRQLSHGRRTSAKTRALATRKAIDPSMSGVQTRRFSWVALSACCSASKVLTLNSSVPTSCTTPAHHSGRRGPGAAPATGRPPAGDGRPGHRACGQQQLQCRGGGEEDRADEEGDAVGARADPVDVRRDRADGEARGPDDEQGGDPPAGHGSAPTTGRAACAHRWLKPLDSSAVIGTVIGCLCKCSMAVRRSSSRVVAMSRLTPWRSRMRCTAMSEAVPVSV